MRAGEPTLTGVIILASYLLGSVPFGFIAARLSGFDITKQGSGSTGATNVLRTLGAAWAVPVLLLDVSKGALSAYLGLKYLDMGALGALIAGAAAIAGHNWSVFLRFHGGKGVAASAGVVLVAFPMVLVAGFGVFLLTVLVTRYVSLGSILGAWAAFLFSLSPGYGWAERIPILVLVCLITYQHRANIGRLLAGKERKIGQKSGPGPTKLDRRDGAAR